MQKRGTKKCDGKPREHGKTVKTERKGERKGVKDRGLVKVHAGNLRKRHTL